MANDTPDLYDMGRKPKRTKTPPVPNQAVQTLIVLYKGLYEARYHQLPVITKADGAAVKRLVTQFDVATVEKYLRAYVAVKDGYAADAGHPLRLLQGEWSRLTATFAKRQRSTSSAEQTRQYLDRMRERAGKKR